MRNLGRVKLPLFTQTYSHIYIFFVTIAYIKIVSTKTCMIFNILDYILCGNIFYQNSINKKHVIQYSCIYSIGQYPYSMWKKVILRWHQQKQCFSIFLSLYYIKIASTKTACHSILLSIFYVTISYIKMHQE